MIPQAELDELCARHPVDQVAGKWVRLRRNGRGWIGPCPVHSPDPLAIVSSSGATWLGSRTRGRTSIV